MVNMGKYIKKIFKINLKNLIIKGYSFSITIEKYIKI